MQAAQNEQRLYGPIERNPVALTALYYLREALEVEEYEECQEIIDIALEFGATQGEVLALLEDIRRLPKAA